MDLASSTDSTSLSYWLSWEFFVCLLSVFTSVIIGSFLIWKYEGSDNTERAWSLFDGEAWMPCVKGLSPICLLAFRIIASCLLLAASIADVATHGTNLFYYYTQWTLILTIIYFVFGSLLSTFGCFQQEKTHNAHFKDLDEEKGIYAPLTGTEKAVNQQGEYYFSETRALWGYIFQIVFQVTAGAVMLTDGVYWLVIFPFLTIVDYEMALSVVPNFIFHLVHCDLRDLRVDCPCLCGYLVLGGCSIASSVLRYVWTLSENKPQHIFQQLPSEGESRDMVGVSMMRIGADSGKNHTASAIADSGKNHTASAIAGSIKV
ncbi:hypothetical protein Tco_1317618 [Tanacetum coccineum]